MRKFKLISFIILLSSVSFVACKRTIYTNPSTNAFLYFHLHTDVDTNEVGSYGTIYVLTGGRKISVTVAQLYLSHIQLVRTDSSVYDVPDRILLKVQETEPYFVGNVPPGTYASVRFTVGLDSVTNLKTPTTADTALNNTSMWFNAAAQPGGYIFVNFQGSIDTTTAGNGNNLIPFMYMIGTNSNKRQVSMPVQSFLLTAGQIQYVHMIIDYSKLLTGVNLVNGNNLMIMTPSNNASAVAKTISDNIPAMFHYE